MNMNFLRSPIELTCKGLQLWGSRPYHWEILGIEQPSNEENYRIGQPYISGSYQPYYSRANTLIKKLLL